MIPSLALSALLAAAAIPQDADFSADEFAKLHPALMKSEKWASIPWRGNLLEARAKAAQEQKPVFIWAMDGKPLGSV